MAEPEWIPIADAPMDGTAISAQRPTEIMRWQPYTKKGRAQMKCRGRWQVLNEYGGWNNADFVPVAWTHLEDPDAR